MFLTKKEICLQVGCKPKTLMCYLMREEFSHLRIYPYQRKINISEKDIELLKKLFNRPCVGQYRGAIVESYYG